MVCHAHASLNVPINHAKITTFPLWGGALRVYAYMDRELQTKSYREWTRITIIGSKVLVLKKNANEGFYKMYLVANYSFMLRELDVCLQKKNPNTSFEVHFENH